ncbi:MAG TPA: PaaI family thioesterase [Gammaproteobacteria bacterium]|nr:PaaI family thioesterase [Gammaproteobacteria bacterium]
MSLNLLKFISRLRFLSQAKRLELYPPFFLMRVKALEISDNWGRVRLRLPLNMVSKNMGGSMFGGYQAALSDPIAALACAKRYPGTDVWTRHHEVDFRKPGNSDLELHFEFPPQLDAQIRAELAATGRSTPSFEYAFYRRDDQLCTWVRSTVAIRPEGYLSGVGRRYKCVKNGP